MESELQQANGRPRARSCLALVPSKVTTPPPRMWHRVAAGGVRCGATCAPEQAALLSVRGAGPVVAVATATLAGDAVLLEDILWTLGAEAGAALGKVAVIFAGPTQNASSLHLHGKWECHLPPEMLTACTDRALAESSAFPQNRWVWTGSSPQFLLTHIRKPPRSHETPRSTLQSWQQSPRAHSAPSLRRHVVALQQRSEHSCEAHRGTGMGMALSASLPSHRQSKISPHLSEPGAGDTSAAVGLGPCRPSSGGLNELLHKVILVREPPWSLFPAYYRPGLEKVKPKGLGFELAQPSRLQRKRSCIEPALVGPQRADKSRLCFSCKIQRENPIATNPCCRERRKEERIKAFPNIP